MLSWRKLMGMEPDVAGKSGGKAPAPPDYEAAAKAQGQANLEAIRTGAALNRVNQVTPYGSVRYEQAAPTTTGSGSQVTIPKTPTGPTTQSYGGGIADVLRSYYSGASQPATQPTMPATTAGSDQWTQYTELSPDQQRIFDLGEQNQIDLGRIAGNRLGEVGNQGPLDFSGQPSRVTGTPTSQFRTDINAPAVAQTGVDLAGLNELPGDLSAERRRVEDALYGSATRYLDPQFSREEEAARTRLINSGNVEGSESWRNTMDELNRRKEGAYGDARDRALLAGGSEASRTLADALKTRQQGVAERFGTGEFANQAAQQQFSSELARNATANAAESDLFGQRLTNAELQNRGRDAGINEQLMLRDRPLQEFLQLYSGGGSPMNPPAIPQAGTPAPEDILGATQAGYQGRIDQYSANNARNAQNTNSLLNLAAIFALSDRRAKYDISHVGILPNGLRTYRFRTVTDSREQIGVMSEDVRERFPEAVITGLDGFDRVNYAAIGAAHLVEH